MAGPFPNPYLCSVQESSVQESPVQESPLQDPSVQDFSLKDLSWEGITPREVILETDHSILYVYSCEGSPAAHHPFPKGSPGLSIPLLMVYSFINRPVILDLMRECSLIRDLLSHGISVYLLVWKDPDVCSDQGKEEKKEKDGTHGENPEDLRDPNHVPNHAANHAPKAPLKDPLSLESCILQEIPQAVSAVKNHKGSSKIHLLGICQGGVLALCKACLDSQDLQSLICLSTPVDFKTPEDHLSWIAHHLPLELLKTLPMISGPLVTQAFLMMNPFRTWRKKIQALSNLQQSPHYAQRFLRIERWVHDSPHQRTALFLDFIKYFYQDNSLLKGHFSIGGQPVRLQNLNLPLLNVVAEADTLVPPAASLILKEFIPPSVYQEHRYPTGHIGLYTHDDHRRSLALTLYRWISRRFS